MKYYEKKILLKFNKIACFCPFVLKNLPHEKIVLKKKLLCILNSNEGLKYIAHQLQRSDLPFGQPFLVASSLKNVHSIVILLVYL